MKTRLLTIGAVAALAAGLLAAPVSAAGTTRWVDKDGAAGPKGCGGGGAAATIATPGISLRAAKPWKAKIAPASPGGGAIVTVAAKNVTVQWLKIMAPTTGSCTQAGQGILIDGVKNARILSNRVLANPNGPTYLGACGLAEGISVDDGSQAAYVANNIVRAFGLVGIIVHNADAQVINNSVQFWHDLDVCAAGAGTACLRAARPAIPLVTTGIRVYQSTGIVDLNAISSAPEGQAPSVRLQHGISTMGVDGVKIRKNDVRLVDFGIWLEASDNLRVIGNIVVGPNALQPSSKRRAAAPASFAQSGILAFSGAGSRFANNHVLHNISGMDATAQTTGATIIGNDFTGNTWDCYDGGGNPANTWSDNPGNADTPNGLCTDGPIQNVPGSPT